MNPEKVLKNFTGKDKLLWFGLLVLVIITGVVWLTIYFETPEDTLRVSFLDVGQGDSIFIETPNGNQILIDGGANKKVLRQLRKAMPFYDRFIDVVVATHPDLDHIGGLVSVIERFDTGLVIKSPVVSGESPEQALNEGTKNEIVVFGVRGSILELDKGVTLEILSPTMEMKNVETNTASIVAKLTYGETSFLLTADAPKSIEEFIIDMGDDIDVDVLKLGHHGSKTSSSLNFLGFTSPEFAVVSAGLDNSYGHPHQEVLDSLTSLNIPVFSTALLGTITFESDGREVVLVR